MTRAATTRINRKTEIEYLESDGKPLGETGTHIDVTLTLLDVLRRYYSRRIDVAVLSNMFIYYVEGNPKKNVAPDLFVTLDVPSNTKRRTFKVWEENKGPNFVLEVTSKKTRNEDLDKKLGIYRDFLKVREYVIFDPLEEYLDPSLQGFRLNRGRYTRMKVESGRLPSEVLGLHLERDGLDLRLYNPRTKRWELTSEEVAETLRNEELARREAQAESERLRRELDQLQKRLKEG